ncbi:ras-related protein Rab-36 isoform X3 [Trichosurus vulpecula]|uniref:ras-related protein Rab-36 isoform X3 n=1 Tax=Trichosurus vulpecula TaxID=9337 RepID=UPI00186B3EC7|nr:ras-related protein Rab-36 isoform X3 [Trichosurus vulpecula]
MGEGPRATASSAILAPGSPRVMFLKPRLKVSKVVVLGDLYVGKTSLINRFCKDVFDRDYKATIGVDFEIERFQIAGIPYSLQIWDTAGQEKFKCIASAYYRGAQVIITTFDLADIQTLGHTRQWLADAQRENEPGSSFVFLVGTKKDLLSGPACERTEMDAVHLANEMQAEYWGEREGFFHPSRCPGLRAVHATRTGKERQPPCPDRGGGLHQCQKGGELSCQPGRCQPQQPWVLLGRDTLSGGC